MPEVIRQGIEVGMDESVLQKAALEEDAVNPVGIFKIDPTYQHMKTSLEKSRKLLAEPNISCAICCSTLNSTKEMALVCPDQQCNSIFHVGCLSTHLLKGEYGAQNAIVPTHGHCPSCKSSLSWTDLVKDLSLRIRGEKEVAALFKEPKRRKKNIKESAKSAAIVYDDIAEEPDVLADESDPELDLDDVLLQSDYEDVDQMQALPSGGDQWKLIDELNDHDTARLIDPASPSAVRVRKAVIEDSDWDEAEVIE
ncbi:hypothetical protein QM012_008403 [Aureobasidium pullulans]|uniref:Structure-specific endonuclease subunit SLX1 C-terminal domain-containing protein n=1 Tax=Aureobasidium pullulans TaxID=5580 RepID=A0ABR0TKC8_AURPU